MEFLKYSNEKNINIIPKKEFSELIEEVFSTISENLGKSLGPLGSNTTIFDGLYTSATKDGYSILKSMKFRNIYKNMIYNLIKVPCTRLNNQVGDGTTSVVVLTSLMHSYYMNHKNSFSTLYRLPRNFTAAWDNVITRLIDKINGYAIPINSDDYEKIYQLSYVASNGNQEISRNIAETYKATNNPTIKLKNSPSNKSYITPIIGFEFPTNLIDEIYTKNEDLSVTLKDSYIMILDHKLESEFCQNVIFPLNDICRSKGHKLLIVAPSYDANLVASSLKYYVNIEFQKHRELNLIPSQYVQGKLDEDHLDDLSIILKGKVITVDCAQRMTAKFIEMNESEKYDFVEDTFNEEHEFHRVIGECTEILASCTNGSIFKPTNLEEDKRYLSALKIAENELNAIKARTDFEKQNYAFEISKAQGRITQFKMKNYIYYIGADSALQANILHDAVEDVVKAVRSAVRSGIVPGCQLSIARACKEIMEEYANKEDIEDELKLEFAISGLVYHAVINLYNLILSGPEKNGILGTIPGWQYTENVDELLKEEEKKRLDIIRTSLQKNQVFDLENLEFTDKIITSAETDIAILLAAGELIKLLISGNQCVYLDAQINGENTTEVDV